MGQARNLAVIAGNGLSVAFTRELLLNKITERLVEHFNDLVEDGTDVLATLRKLAERIEDDGAIDEKDFEQLVGSFESQAALLDDLSELAEILPDGSTDLPAAIKEVQKFTRKVLSRGTGLVLKTILEAADELPDSAVSIQQVFEAMDDCFDGRVTFANLNYDILVLSTMRKLRLSMCDMGEGFSRSTLVITRENGGDSVELGRYKGNQLRKELNFPGSSKFRLVHPHGSLTYWENTETKIVTKLPIDALRENDLFTNLAESSGKSRPAVVLANSREKPKRVKSYPFSLAYEAMSLGLDDSAHWLIIGYSFRDESVNSAIRIALSKKKKKPKILVSTYGDELTRDMILRAIGWGDTPSSTNVWIDRRGVQGLEERWKWDEFTVN